MYLPKINENQMKRLYELREYLKEKGYKATIAGLVREMIDNGLTRYDELINVDKIKKIENRNNN